MSGHGAEFDRQRRERLAALSLALKSWRRWSREMERALDQPRQPKANESANQEAARRRRGR